MYEKDLLEEAKRTNRYLRSILEKMPKGKERFTPYDPKKYYDAPALAQLFSVSKRTIYKWGQDGRLPRLRMGGRLLFPKKEIDDLLVKRETLGKDWFEEFTGE